MLAVKAAQAALDESRSSGADDIRHLQWRPAHGFYAGVGESSVSPSSGLAVASRCRRDRCK
jgi:hypothetical protein